MFTSKTPYSFFRQLAAIVAALAVVQATYFIFVRAAQFAAGPKWFEAGPFVAVFMLVSIALGVVAWEAVSRSPELRQLLPLRPRLQVLTVAITLPVLSLIAILASLGFGASVTIPEFRLGTTPALFKLATIFLLALREEIFYRYFLFGVFTRLTRSVPVGLLGSSVMFMLGHSKSSLFVFAGGLCFGAIALRTRSIWVSTAAHFATNLFIDLVFSPSVIASPSILGIWGLGRFHAFVPWVAIPVAVALLREPLRHDPTVLWVAAQLRRPFRRVAEA